MSESNSRKPVFQDYYTDEDYDQVMEQLPGIVKDAERKASMVLEPTIDEKREVMNFIKDFIRTKKRKVYGGTSLNETLKLKNPKDAIYDDFTFSDIEFYSPTPVPDLVELCDALDAKGYKMVQGKEAQHEETYSIFVNLQLYCDITYVPTRVYNGIKTIEIDGINYVHPHFMLIDYLRVYNDPMGAAGQRWEKYFPRIYKLLKNYPLEHFDKPLQVPKPSNEIIAYLAKIKTEFMTTKEAQKSCLISGFEAYNFFVKHAAKDRNVEQMARTTYGKSKVIDLQCNVPYLEFISVTYRDTVDQLYSFVKSIVPKPEDVKLEEYFPLFQFTEYSVFITYQGQPIVRVFEADGRCIPNIKTTQGYMYVSYQYLLMSMFISKFRAFLDKDQKMYFNYGIAISNLVKVRNIYLTENNLGVINKSVFGEFKVACVGSTVSYTRMSLLRKLKRIKQGKSAQFAYMPESFAKQSEEAKAKFDPKKHMFRNTSGNKIPVLDSKGNPNRNLRFRLDVDRNIIKMDETEDTFSEESDEEETETESEQPEQNNESSEAPKSE
jgi:hypothetical protein